MDEKAAEHIASGMRDIASAITVAAVCLFFGMLSLSLTLGRHDGVPAALTEDMKDAACYLGGGTDRVGHECVRPSALP